jgi:hypothetical protein
LTRRAPIAAAPALAFTLIKGGAGRVAHLTSRGHARRRID